MKPSSRSLTATVSPMYGLKHQVHFRDYNVKPCCVIRRRGKSRLYYIENERLHFVTIVSAHHRLFFKSNCSFFKQLTYNPVYLRTSQILILLVCPTPAFSSVVKPRQRKYLRRSCSHLRKFRRLRYTPKNTLKVVKFSVNFLKLIIRN